MIRFVGCGFGNGNGGILVEFHALRLGQILQGVAVLRVGGEKCQGQAEWFIGRSAAKKLQGVVLILLRDVDFHPVRPGHPVGSAVGATEVVILFRKRAVVPLADVSDVISMAPQQSWIGFGPGCLERIHGDIAVARHPLAGHQRGAADAADRSGHAGVGESSAFLGELIEPGCLHNRVARAAQGVEAPVIGLKDQNVQRSVRRSGGKVTGEEKQQMEQEMSHDGLRGIL